MARRREHLLLSLGFAGVAGVPLAATALPACGSSGGDTADAADVPADADAEASLGMGDFFNCGRITSIFDDIGETAVGLPITVRGTSSGPNPAKLTFAWSVSPSNAGTFSPSTGSGAAPITRFTCGMAGTVTITLTASDGTVPNGAPSCHDVDHMSLVVVCDPVRDAGSG
jgi:hypothetical protein